MTTVTAIEREAISLEALRFPIGRFDPHAPVDDQALRSAIAMVATVPRVIRRAVANLTDVDLAMRYRPGGWTVRQIVHHLADANAQDYMRVRLALTESRPMVRLYDDTAWGALADARNAPIEPSLTLLDGLHVRWATLLRSLSPADFDREFLHPDWGTVSLRAHTWFIEWHVRHHAAHIALALEEQFSVLGPRTED